MARRQLCVSAGFAALLAVIVTILYLQDRSRERTLRSEQANRRLDIAVELISREVDRVRADALFLADQKLLGQFAKGDASRREALETEYASFVHRKQTYDQIRLLDPAGRERIRVNFLGDRAVAVAPTELQDKSNRYYFREALGLQAGEVFVSDFDLNLEHGQIERPLKPVIRFVASVPDETGTTVGFVVLNYLGSRLLHELNYFTLPGYTMLIRTDGNYVRSPDPDDSWGWLLGHDRSFANQFPAEWAMIDKMRDFTLTARGGCAARRIRVVMPLRSPGPESQDAYQRHSIIAVSYLPRDQVFAAANDLLTRLLWLAGCIFVPLAVFARYWAKASSSREDQAHRIAKSEERLRELSSRLLRIQEDERRAISREIHDELGQQVTAINLDLKLADRVAESEAGNSHLKRAIHENEGLLQTLHEFARRVRPAVLDDLGLQEAVESHLREFQERTGIEVESKLGISSDTMPNEVADNVYRLLQESLNNVVKHAGASLVNVTLSSQPRGPSSQLYMAIRDDGCGCDPSADNRHRLGILGMQERVDLLGGELRVESENNRGTKIEVWLPLRSTAQAENRV